MCNVEGPPLKKRRPQPLPAAEPMPIYLDYNATTPLCDEAWRAMGAVHKVWGNPSSSHPFGLAAKYALEEARDKVKRAINAPTAESIVFTSGGTESNNMAIIGGASATQAADTNRNVIVSTNVEHPAVSEVLNFLRLSTGILFDIHIADVNPKTGRLDVDTLVDVLGRIPGGAHKVALVTVMFANNEIGSVNDIRELVKATKRTCGHQCLFHTDAAQALGKVPADVQELNVDLLSVCGHKFYAPKGSGALYIKPGVVVKNILYGAGHERGMRPGTENVLFANALAEALLYASENIEAFACVMRRTRDELAAVLREELRQHDMDYVVNGELACVLPNTLNCAVYKNIPDRKAGIDVTYISAARLIMTVGDEVCMSAGSACHSTAGEDEEIEVSAPLRAVGVSLQRAIGTLRMSTGRGTSMEEVRRAAKIIARRAAQQFAE